MQSGQVQGMIRNRFSLWCTLPFKISKKHLTTSLLSLNAEYNSAACNECNTWRINLNIEHPHNRLELRNPIGLSPLSVSLHMCSWDLMFDPLTLMANLSHYLVKLISGFQAKGPVKKMGRKFVLFSYIIIIAILLA